MVVAHFEDILLKVFPFGLVGDASVGELDGSFDLQMQSVEFLFHAEGEGNGPVAHGLAVEQGECLRRDGGGIAFLAGIVGVGLVEQLEERIGLPADTVGVDGAAVALTRGG